MIQTLPDPIGPSRLVLAAVHSARWVVILLALAAVASGVIALAAAMPGGMA